MAFSIAERDSRRPNLGGPKDLALLETKSLAKKWRDDAQAMKVQADEDDKAGLKDISGDAYHRNSIYDEVARIISIGVKVVEGERAAEKAKAESAERQKVAAR